MWDEITYASPNFNSATFLMNKKLNPKLYLVCDYLSVMGLKLIDISKGDTMCHRIMMNICKSYVSGGQ